MSNPYNLCSICKLELKMVEYFFGMNIHTGESFDLCQACFAKQTPKQLEGMHFIRVYDCFEFFPKKDYDRMVDRLKQIPNQSRK